MKKFFIAIVAMCLLLVGVATPATDTDSTTATVTVNAYLSVTLTKAPVNFPNADPLETVSAGANNGYPLTVTIDDVSNVNAKVETKADNANFCTDYDTCIEDTFAVSNMEWDDANTGPWTNYTISDAIVCASVAPTGTCDIYHQLTIPSAQTAGDYSTGITITATQV